MIWNKGTAEYQMLKQTSIVITSCSILDIPIHTLSFADAFLILGK
jgi:hypothetical protein